MRKSMPISAQPVRTKLNQKLCSSLHVRMVRIEHYPHMPDRMPSSLLCRPNNRFLLAEMPHRHKQVRRQYQSFMRPELSQFHRPDNKLACDNLLR